MWSEQKDAPSGLDDLVNYAQWLAPGVILLKDGGLLTAWHYGGPDLDLAAPEELERLAAHANAALARCGTGWMLHLDVICRDTRLYLPPGAFPDPTSALIDEERRRHYINEAHYTHVQALALTYLPPSDLTQDLAGLLYEGQEAQATRLDLVLETFTHTVQEIEDLLGHVLRLVRMTDEELLTYLHCCVTGEDRLVRRPAVGVDLDTLIADCDLVGGFRPQLGDRSVRVVSVDGYPSMTQPSILTVLHDLPMAYRWSIRFLFLDRVEAEALIATRQKHWWQQRHSAGAKIGEMAAGASARLENAGAVQMAEDANDAAAEAASGTVLYGLSTMTVIVQDEDEGRVDLQAREIQKHVQRCGFGARIERANTLEALIGSWPGHGYQNVRKALLHTLNLADLLPLTSVWAGLPRNPNPFFPADAPPLMLTATGGKTPFNLNLDVDDAGHTLIEGPSGSGKSTLLTMLMAQWRRYEGAQVFAFDKGYSAFPLCRACGGDFYDIGADEPVAFVPLGQVDDPIEREWALGWCEELLRLQGVAITPEQRSALWHALSLMGTRDHHRTLTGLCLDVQDRSVREGLRHYTVSGGAGTLLDAEQDSLQASRFMVFEMEHLLARGDQDVIPVLLYLFHWIDRRCRQGLPTLLAIDEAWLMLLRSQFALTIEEWLRTKRRENVRVVLATQSLADIERSPQRAILVESCQTKIFLPNAEARTTQSAAAYRALGLNEPQIETLASTIPKKHYLYTSPYGRRVFDLQLGPVALAFTGVNDRADVRRVRALIAEHGEDWPAYWLQERGRRAEAQWWRRWRPQQIQREDPYAQLWQETNGSSGNGLSTHAGMDPAESRAMAESERRGNVGL
jgi:type IV secretion system protein TrbE